MLNAAPHFEPTLLQESESLAIDHVHGALQCLVVGHDVGPMTADIELQMSGAHDHHTDNDSETSSASVTDAVTSGKKRASLSPSHAFEKAAATPTTSDGEHKKYKKSTYIAQKVRR